MNRGAAFVSNYVTRCWPKERDQPKWTIQPTEKDMSIVYVLYQYGTFDEIPENERKRGHELFANLQLVFRVELSEHHPYTAPSIKAMTPNGRFEVNESLCIKGITKWHPEAWNIITTMGAIIERFAVAFVDMEEVNNGVGFVRNFSEAKVKKCVEESVEYNQKNYASLVSEWNIQRNEYYAKQERMREMAAMAIEAPPPPPPVVPVLEVEKDEIVGEEEALDSFDNPDFEMI